MNQEEKEERIKNHKNYWDTVDKIREVSLEALDNLCVGDMISALDRIKTELMQQDVLVMMEEVLERSGEGEESEEDVAVHPQIDIQTTMPLVNPAELQNAVRRAMNN